MNRTLESLAADIGAVQISPRRWAHYADETRSYWICSSADLRYIADCQSAHPRDWYSHWCAGTAAREMPDGWTP